MKTNLIHLTIIALIVIISIILGIIMTRLEPKQIIIDLPEEISLANSNDTLIGHLNKTKDTLFIEFNNKYK